MTQKKIFLILWTLYSAKEKIIDCFPLDLFKGTILCLQFTVVLTWSETQDVKNLIP